MHIIKNIFENLNGTLFNIPRKIKDNIKVRQDMVEMSMRLELAPVEEDGKRTFSVGDMLYAIMKRETQFIGVSPFH
jgi:hypothetical protein